MSAKENDWTEQLLGDDYTAYHTCSVQRHEALAVVTMVVEVRDRRRLEERLEAQTETESQTEAQKEKETEAGTRPAAAAEAEEETRPEADTRPETEAARQRLRDRGDREAEGHAPRLRSSDR